MWVQDMIKSWIPGVEIANLENVFPEKAQRVYNLQSGKVILQTRDLLNWYASYRRGDPKFSRGSIPYWEHITYEFYHLTDFLIGHDVVRVRYEDFFTSRKYRIKVCDQLGGVYNEDRLQTVSVGGKGSSFTEMEYQGKASEMKTLNRYEQVNPVMYERLFHHRPDLWDFYFQYQATEQSANYLKLMESCKVQS